MGKAQNFLTAPRTNGKESLKMIQDPRKNPDYHRSLIDSYLHHAPSLHRISPPSVRNFWDILHTDTMTRRIQRIHNLLSRGSNTIR